jgi:hypothetical protein
MPGGCVTVEVSGHEAGQAALSLLEHEGRAAFTAVQVRGGRARGLDRHLSRLEAARQDIDGRAPGGQEVRARSRHVPGGRLGARVRGDRSGLIVAVREPQDRPRRGWQR